MSPDGLPRIQVLPASLANQIAAGEVVERPASVLKELVENSLDAGAGRIDIETAGGGIELIRVLDDGHGIHPMDVELALERHATSKVRQAVDLDGIRTLGFRGEALPSIAAVAGFRLTSRIRAESSGREVEFDPLNGRRRSGPAPHPVGTTVEVRGLFRSVPARRKFLRSERTEYLHLLDMVRRLALSPLARSLRFRHDGRPALRAEGEAEDRIAAILGAGFVRATLPIDCTAGALRVHGRIGRPDSHRSQSDQQFLYLNDRMIRDRQISHAIRQAFGDLIPAGRFPVYLLYVVMDASAADVNVHPTKQEVRFRQARDVHDFLFAAVREALAVANRLPVSAPPVVAEPAPVYRHAPAPASPPRKGLGTPIAQLGGRYLLTERDGRWLLVDARALLRERLLTGIRRALASGEALRARPLLVPVHAAVTTEAAEAAERHTTRLAGFGLELGRIGPDRIAVRAVPALLADADAARLATGILDLLARHGEAADLAARLADCVPEAPCAGLDGIALADWLRHAGECELDFTAAACAGLWRTLGVEELERLLGRHGR